MVAIENWLHCQIVNFPTKCPIQIKIAVGFEFIYPGTYRTFVQSVHNSKTMSLISGPIFSRHLYRKSFDMHRIAATPATARTGSSVNWTALRLKSGSYFLRCRTLLISTCHCYYQWLTRVSPFHSRINVAIYHRHGHQCRALHFVAIFH